MAPGTGTPEPGGLTSRQLLDAVRRAAVELPLVGIEVVEVAPPYDSSDITAMLANRVVLEALSGMPCAGAHGGPVGCRGRCAETADFYRTSVSRPYDDHPAGCPGPATEQEYRAGPCTGAGMVHGSI
jgi:hypothetical protein